ncbi:unnamed protein product [Nesidiocoris tenuis]|uniref:Uncharacterized protein n=1 Tax=Nesidiocoris tenuis TaxID=355587 RepID=A0A6H5GPG9_9HEMI|nr:unnamed protein product [Nesidiocoris tenuis]
MMSMFLSFSLSWTTIMSTKKIAPQPREEIFSPPSKRPNGRNYVQWAPRSVGASGMK